MHVKTSIRGLIISKWSRSIYNDNYSIIQCGGEPENAPVTNENLSHVFKINIKTKTTQTLASMITGRSDFCLTLLNGYIYALGGVNYLNNITKKCERYSLEYNR